MSVARLSCITYIIVLQTNVPGKKDITLHKLLKFVLESDIITGKNPDITNQEI